MAGGANMDDDDEITGINVTPLVDIMLVLLIIFMVASNYIVKESIEVNLPKAATGEEDNAENNALALIIKKDGSLYLDGKPTNYEAIGAASRALAKKRDPIALIAADRDTSHGAVVKLIDLVRVNGLTSFAINIDPERDPVVVEPAEQDQEDAEQGDAAQDTSPADKENP